MNARRSSHALAFGFVMVKDSGVEPPTPISAAPKDLTIAGGAATTRVAVAGGPGPPSFDAIGPVVLCLTPSLRCGHVGGELAASAAASDAPLSEIVPRRAGAMIAAAAGAGQAVRVATTRPDGRVSVKPMPVRASVAFGLVT